MPTAKKPATSTKPGAAKTATTKGKTGAKKPTALAAVARRPPATTTVVAKPVAPKAGAAPKKTTASVSVTRTSNPRASSVTVKKITRNIVGFYMTEDIEIRRATRSDNMSSEKLKAKYAQLKTKIKAR